MKTIMLLFAFISVAPRVGCGNNHHGNESTPAGVPEAANPNASRTNGTVPNHPATTNSIN